MSGQNDNTDNINMDDSQTAGLLKFIKPKVV